MRYLAYALFTIITIHSCRKEKCIEDLKTVISKDIHFREVNCSSPGIGDQSFQWKFSNEESFIQFECSPSNIPIEIGFDGIIIAQGVRVPFFGPNGGDPGYSLDVELIKDECKKEIDFHFILTTIDTSTYLPHAESVIVVLNGIDSTYKINYSHEIIPYKE